MSTVGVVMGIGIALIIIALIFIVLYALYLKPTKYHTVNINSLGSQAVMSIGAEGNNGVIQYLPDMQLVPGTTRRIIATPGSRIVIHRKDDMGTTCELRLRGDNYASGTMLSDESSVIRGIRNGGYGTDTYSMSVQQEYNGKLNIAPSANFRQEAPTDCEPIIWSEGPIACTEASPCVSPCQTTRNAVYCCENPGACTQIGGCQATWPDRTYYDKFRAACPKCLITQCDTDIVVCRSTSDTVLSEYTVTVW